ncbi:MAG: creatininase family protein [candidate division Zixibacteria bacterium]|nr:creatininase family protein [candidate division Zixibacteria bacterium]
MERQLQKLHWQKIKELVPDKINTVILPVGTIEGHGSSCIGTDNYIPEDISLGIADRINSIVAPILNYGITKSLYRYNGGITLSPETYQDVISEILESLTDVGFDNIIVMNGHGGNNTVLKQVASDFHHDNLSNIAVIHWWELCGEMTKEFFGHAGGHA